MVRTTVMADGALLEQLRRIARDEGKSLGEVMREGLEWRVRTRRRPPSFIGAIETGGDPHDTGARAEEVLLEYFRSRDAAV